tara:strand:+ start:222 stop:878 length:657 start_codon:yes stop_codon:yes gene_type:complete
MPIYQLQDTKNKEQVSFFHIHIPKTGGTMLENFFSSIGLRSFGAGHEYMFVRHYLKSPPNHYDMKILEQLFFFDKIYSFAITRDPLKRCYSQYQWARSNKCTHSDLFLEMTFEDFVVDSFEKYSSNEYYMANYIKPQHHFISDKVNRIFKVEDGLEKAIKEVFNDLKIRMRFKNEKEDFKFPYINKSKPYNKDIVNENVIKMIKEFYKEDYEKFGYKL